ncbi:glutamine amidotransferase [Sporolactobacillus terrae]|uniref:glutamine amidotransferase n=1 Tax=Sporolactobacillus terrae TaxID=269673 RepID=UPI00111B5372|nr:glutamine amidotransferase [Sporolactobacillus terrae]
MKILFVGESWVIHMIHTKGFDSFTSTKYEEGATYLLQCLREEGIAITYIPSHEVQLRFPSTLEELKSFDAIVLSDIGSNTFLLRNATFYDMKVEPNPLELIKAFVRQGGGLLMIGGYLSFTGIDGKANYKNTSLADVLPVELMGTDDRVEMPQGVYPETVKERIVTNDLGKWPLFLGYNKFTPKKDADVLATIAGDPLLVTGRYGEGNTACFASDCAPHWGSKEFVTWKNYKMFWSRLVQFVGKKR